MANRLLQEYRWYVVIVGHRVYASDEELALDLGITVTLLAALNQFCVGCGL